MKHAPAAASILGVAILAQLSCTAGDPKSFAATRANDAGVTVLDAVGADSMQDLMACWSSEFSYRYPDIQIRFRAGLSADGAAAMLNDEADIVPFAREPFHAESDAFAQAFGRQPKLFRVATGSFAAPGKTHAIAIFVNEDNPIASLDVSQLAQIFGENGTHTWGDFGLTGAWADKPVQAIGMINRRASGNPPGIVNFIQERINGGRRLTDSILQVRGTAHSHALAEIVRDIAQDRYAIGYSGFGFAYPGSRPIPISSGSEPPVTASPATVASHEYPLARFLYLAVRPDWAPDKHEAASAFVEFVLSATGQRCVGRDPAGFFALPARILGGEHRKLSDVEERIPAYEPHPVSLPDEASYRTADGRIRIVGYNDMQYLLEAVNRVFRASHPGFDFELDLRGTRTAPPALTSGISAFAPMGAEFSHDALEEFRRVNGSAPLGFRVAHASTNPEALSGPLALLVHRSNPLRRLSLDQARRIFAGNASDAISRWGQLGLQGAWAKRPIEACGLHPETALGTFFRNKVLAGRSFAGNFRGFDQSAAVVGHVAEARSALCFAALNRGSPDTLALAVSVDESDRPQIGTAATIQAGEYPLDRYLYIYVAPPNGGPLDAFVVEYLRLMLSREGQNAVRDSRPGYLPLNGLEVREQLANLEASFLRR